MPDICMCTGTNCPKAKSCYRFTATPSKFMQSYFTEPPINEDGTCEYYWPNTDESADDEKQQ